MSYDIEETLYRIEDMMKKFDDEALTKRERFAMAAMSGFCGQANSIFSYKNIIEASLRVADELIAELEKDIEK